MPRMVLTVSAQKYTTRGTDPNNDDDILYFRQQKAELERRIREMGFSGSVSISIERDRQ